MSLRGAYIYAVHLALTSGPRDRRPRRDTGVRFRLVDRARVRVAVELELAYSTVLSAYRTALSACHRTVLPAYRSVPPAYRSVHPAYRSVHPVYCGVHPVYRTVLSA